MNISNRHHGNTLAEYGLILGMTAILAILALQALGSSVFKLFDSGKQLESSGSRLVSMDFGFTQPNPEVAAPASTVSADVTASTTSSIARGSVHLSGKGFYTVHVDNTGEPTLHLVDSGTGGVTNATSVDGKRWNLLGTLQLATTLEALAKQTADPDIASYIAELAKKSYYMGGAQGELDGVSQLESPNMSYSNNDALADVIRYQGDLKAAMENMPAGMDPALKAQVMALTTDVYNIGQTYYNRFEQYAGNPDQNFIISYSLDCTGCGLAGQSLSPATRVKVKPDTDGSKPYEDVLSYSKLKQVAAEVLNDNRVESAQVEATFQDATALDAKAAAPAAPGGKG